VTRKSNRGDAPLFINRTINAAKLKSVAIDGSQKLISCQTGQLIRRVQATSDIVGNEKSRVSDHNLGAI